MNVHSLPRIKQHDSEMLQLQRDRHRVLRGFGEGRGEVRAFSV